MQIASRSGRWLTSTVSLTASLGQVERSFRKRGVNPPGPPTARPPSMQPNQAPHDAGAYRKLPTTAARVAVALRMGAPAVVAVHIARRSLWWPERPPGSITRSATAQASARDTDVRPRRPSRTSDRRDDVSKSRAWLRVQAPLVVRDQCHWSDA